MDYAKLKEFNNDEAMRNAWAEFIMEVLNTEALKRVYSGKDTIALKEVREIIEKSFSQLRENFKVKEERKVGEVAI